MAQGGFPSDGTQVAEKQLDLPASWNRGWIYSTRIGFSRFISYIRVRPLTLADAGRLYRSYVVSAVGRLKNRGHFGGVGSHLDGTKAVNVQISGLRFSIRPRSEDLTYILPDHKPTVTRWFRPERGQFVVDVGSHVGFFSLIAAAKGASVVSVDPNPRVIAVLQEGARLNGLKDLEIHQTAIGERAGKAILEVPLIWDGKSSLVSGWATGRRPGARFDRIEVEVMTLDTLLQHRSERCIDWLLIDVEGSELEVLKGAERTLGRTAHILVEVSFASKDEVVKLLAEPFGFRINSIEHQTPFTSYVVATKAVRGREETS